MSTKTFSSATLGVRRPIGALVVSRLAASRQVATYESGDGSPHSKTMLVQIAAGSAFEQGDGVFEYGRDHGEALAHALG